MLTLVSRGSAVEKPCVLAVAGAEPCALKRDRDKSCDLRVDESEPCYGMDGGDAEHICDFAGGQDKP